MTARITQLDTARGAAVLGILIMNSVSFAFGSIAYFDVSLPKPIWVGDTAAGVFGEVFADQKFMGVFSLLFGASMLLFLERVSARSPHAIRLSLWRNTLLLFIGFAHSLLWVGDVLLIYAVCAPVLLLCHRLSARTLQVLGCGVFTLSLASAWMLGAIDDAHIRTLWAGTANTPTEEWVGLLILTDLGSRSLGMMFLGMGLYKSGFLKRPLAPGGLTKSVVAIVIAAGVSACGQWWVATQGPDAAVIGRANVLNGFATIPMAVGYLGLFMAWDRRSTGPWIRRVQALGKMALTNYLSQTVLCMALVAYLPSPWLTRSSVWLGIHCIWALQLFASEAWLNRYRMGPIEWLWRCATYRQWAPLRRVVSYP